MAIINREKEGRGRAEFVCDMAGCFLTVRIRGEIDHHTAVSIRQGIDTLLFERQPKKLILDLSAVSFMDSSGLGLIMGRVSVMRELGGTLTVWDPSRETRKILDLAGMDRLLSIEYPPGGGQSVQPPPPRPPRVRDNRTGPAIRRRAAAPREGAERTTRKEKDA